MTLTQLMEALWTQYTQITPSAKKIHALLGRNAPLVNDHIALRTMRYGDVGVDALGAFFTQLGYQEAGEYRFKAKKLYAKHFQSHDETQPKIFISELILEECSDFVRETLQGLVDQISADAPRSAALLYSGTHWQVDHTTYTKLLQESEYAAWFSAFGYRANHFTVSVNHLADFETLEAVNVYLVENGFRLNESGGLIKGSPEVCLEQSATLADPTIVAFSDGQQPIPGCFYEFARRYAMKNGDLYHGFVEASADKIFESTNVK